MTFWPILVEKPTSVWLRYVCYVDCIFPAEESAARALNHLMHVLYNSDMWLSREVALECIKSGTYFRSTYGFLAASSAGKGQTRFPWLPKIHSFEEIIFAMECQCKLSTYVLNPLVESCQLDEDFIGHAAFITRHVSPRLMALRTFNRYLTQIMISWHH